jgi:hypothetical protein
VLSVAVLIGRLRALGNVMFFSSLFRHIVSR